MMAKMVRRTCAFCSEGEAASIMYVAREQNIAAHQSCLLFSSGFVESEEYNPENLDLRFDVESVLNELKRGKRLVCNFCRKKGATVGCEERACRRSYHYFCALCDDAAIQTDEVNGVYRVFCSKHDPGNRTNHYDAANKRKRHASKSSTTMEQMRAEETAEENRLRILRRKSSRHKVRIDFLRKCKQAGLLDDIFEEMLDTLHLAQEKLMDDNTSETEYEETVISLFDCGLFENILTNIHSVSLDAAVQQNWTTTIPIASSGGRSTLSVYKYSRKARYTGQGLLHKVHAAMVSSPHSSSLPSTKEILQYLENFLSSLSMHRPAVKFAA